MVAFSGFQLSLLEAFLSFGFLSLLVSTIICLKRIARLQCQMNAFQSNAKREIKMVNQGAIGLGRRFSNLEARFKKSTMVTKSEVMNLTKKNQVSAFELIRNQAVQEPETSTPSEQAQVEVANINQPRPRKLKTQAEQTLSRWINEQQTA
jgi:hypothetical protein